MVDPSQDGSIYTCNGCNQTPVTSMYLMTAGYIQGDVRFSTSAFAQQSIEDATLELTPYASPLWGPTIEIFGYTAQSGQLAYADANSGTFLGDLSVPMYSGPLSFDVTSFLQSANGPFVGFDLITATGPDIFGSLNIGTPAQLHINDEPLAAGTTVPEPATWALLAIGLIAIGAASYRKQPPSMRMA